MKIEIESKTASEPLYLGQSLSSVEEVMGQKSKRFKGEPGSPRSFYCYYEKHDTKVLFNGNSEAIFFDFGVVAGDQVPMSLAGLSLGPTVQNLEILEQRPIFVAGVNIDFRVENLALLEKMGHAISQFSDAFQVDDLNVTIRIPPDSERSESSLAYYSDEYEAIPFEYSDLVKFEPVTFL